MFSLGRDIPYIEKDSDGKYYLHCPVCGGKDLCVKQLSPQLNLKSIVCNTCTNKRGGQTVVCNISDIKGLVDQATTDPDMHKIIIRDIEQNIGFPFNR